MKSSTVFALSSITVIAAMALVPGCSDSDTPASPTPNPTDDAGTEDGTVAIKDLGAPAIPCSDSVDSLYGDPGTLPPGKGVIVKCHEDPNLSQDGLQKKLDDLGYKGKPLTSGARTIRVTYTTERGDAANTRSVSSALVYIPTSPRANASELPIVVGARGSRGQGPDCTASKRKEGLGVNADLDRLAFGIVGHGYPVIIPDLPGYANFNAPGNPPSAYNDAKDVGKGTLDGSRALKQLYPKLADKTVIVGHSQGGHSALAALALSDSYGVQGTISGVAVYAPLWVTQRSWGALLSPSIAQSLGYTIKDQPSASAVMIWYHYTKAELLDGPGEGLKLFKDAAKATVKQFVETQCFAPPYPQLEALGTYAHELFEDSFRDSVGDAASGIFQCPGTDAVCAKWVERYKNDRPHITSKVPIVMLYGGNDQTIPSDRLKCAYDTLVSDGTNLSLCYEAAPGGAGVNSHQGILDAKSDWVADWIANVAMGGPAPAKCGGGAEAVADKTCATPPPND